MRTVQGENIEQQENWRERKPKQKRLEFHIMRLRSETNGKQERGGRRGTERDEGGANSPFSLAL